MTLTLTDKNFEEEIINYNGLALVDFYADWCGPCKSLSPIIDDLSNAFEDKLKIGKIDVDINTETSKKYTIRSIPNILFFKNGEVVENRVGIISKETLIEIIKKYII